MPRLDLLPKYTYLTRSFVDWLGLHIGIGFFPVANCGWVGENAAKPAFGAELGRCVEYDGWWYRESEDGLSFDLHSQWPF